MIRASVARIWENVLDWEHLPWLHATTFAAVRSVEASATGWRAWVAPRVRAEESLVAVSVDRPALRYVTRTLDGPGAGSEIWTALFPQSGNETRIAVDFRLAIEDPDRAAAVGRAYAALYERLWTEDEGMMVRRQAILDAKAGGLGRVGADPVPLGPIAEVRARLPYPIHVGGTELRLVEVAGEVHAHPTVCPHRGGPLEVSANGDVACPWHGYRFDLRSGRCTSGRSLHLRPPPRVVVDPASGEASLHLGTPWN